MSYNNLMILIVSQFVTAFDRENHLSTVSNFWWQIIKQHFLADCIRRKHVYKMWANDDSSVGIFWKICWLTFPPCQLHSAPEYMISVCRPSSSWCSTTYLNSYCETVHWLIYHWIISHIFMPHILYVGGWKLGSSSLWKSHVAMDFFRTGGLNSIP